MSDKARLIEPERLKIKLLNGTELEVRSLTLAERKECMALLPKDFTKDPDQFVEVYMRVQGDVIHYIITRINPNFTRKDVDTQLDASVIEKIIIFALRDPFADFI